MSRKTYRRKKKKFLNTKYSIQFVKNQTKKIEDYIENYMDVNNYKTFKFSNIAGITISDYVAILIQQDYEIENHVYIAENIIKQGVITFNN